MEGFWKKRLLSEDGIRRKEKSIPCSIFCPSLRSSLALFPSPHGLWRDLSHPILKFHKAHNTPWLFQKSCRKWRIASFCWCFSCFGFLGARRMGASQNIWISLHGHRRSKKSLTASVLRLIQWYTRDSTKGLPATALEILTMLSVSCISDCIRYKAPALSP